MTADELLTSLRLLGLTSSEQPALRLADEPFVPAYWCKSSTEDLNSRSEVSFSGYGSDTDRDWARVKSHAECIETYCLYSPSNVLASGCSVEGEKHSPYVNNWAKASGFAKSDLSLYQSCRCVHLLTGSEILLPAQLIGLFSLKAGEERIIPERTSAGTAFGPKGTGIATCNALLEVLEKDAVIRAFHARAEIRRLDQAQIGNDDLFAAIKRYRLLPYVYLVPNTGGIPVILVILIDECNTGLAVSTGSAAGFSLHATVRRSLIEALQGRSARRLWILQHEAPHPSVHPESIETLEQRVAYWSTTASIDHLRFWLDLPMMPVPDNARIASLKELIGVLTSAGTDVYVADITPPSLSRHGFEVVRVVSPHCTPIYMKESSASHWFAKPLGSYTPHPFF